MCKFKRIFLRFLLLFLTLTNFSSAKEIKIPKYDWTFKGITGTFDRSALQRGYQVYTEVCASCHSMNLLSHRNLGEKGGPNSDGEMFTRPGRPSDKFVSPYPNIEAATAANGGAYPPDMSVLVKARKGGADYIYAVLMGYTEPPPDFQLEEGVYYNKYMDGNKIKMSNPLSDDLVTYADGTEATQAQMAKDVTTFLTWSAEPHLEERHKLGFKVVIFLIILSTLVYFSMRKLWSRIDPKD